MNFFVECIPRELSFLRDSRFGTAGANRNQREGFHSRAEATSLQANSGGAVSSVSANFNTVDPRIGTSSRSQRGRGLDYRSVAPPHNYDSRANSDDGGRDERGDSRSPHTQASPHYRGGDGIVPGCQSEYRTAE